MGGQTGAMIGSAIGGGAGAAASANKRDRNGAIIGGALGGAGGYTVGKNMGGTNGGYILYKNVVVAKDNSGSYVAATQVCSHEGLQRIVFRKDQWYCPEHGATFDLAGGGLNSEAKRGLTIYNTELNNNILRVFS